jgi:16S rRNA pseudouridine516 synthase
MEVFEGKVFEVLGKHWTYWSRAYLMLHKPSGFECSQKPSTWPSIYTLLPAPLRQRPNKSAVMGVQAVGRLDQDTTGLILLSDDGAFIHKMSSPKHHVPKVYEVCTEHEMGQLALDQLLQGVVLNDSNQPVKAERVEKIGDKEIAMVLTQGKYHQVKRMIAAVGHLVVKLHRSKIGGLTLPEDLAAGQWRFLSAEQLQQLRPSSEDKAIQKI